MKIAIIGSREFPDLAWVREFVFSLPTDTEIVSGECKIGVDRIAKEVAIQRGFVYTPFPAEWRKYPGNSAAAIRNRKIVEYSDLVVAFWDKQSKGTRMVLRFCLELNRSFRVYVIENGERVYYIRRIPRL